MLPRRLFLYAVIALATGQATAQTTKTIREEYSHALKAAETVSAFGPELFGESVNLKDGVTSFNATDVAAKTNSGLPLMVGRSLGINARDIDEYVNKAADGELFGNWKLDVPMIRGTFDERTGWVVNSATPQLRCSSGIVPPAVGSAFTGWNISYYPEQYWRGNEVDIPGKGGGPLLALAAGQPRPSDGQSYPWTTKDGWRVSCVPALKNGSGEGFKVALPDGTKYTFDWMSSRKVASLKDKQCKTAFYNEYNVANWQQSYYTLEWSPGGPGGTPHLQWRLHRMDGGSASGGSRQVNFCQEQVVVNRREYFLHATKVEDRFGNTVVYDYDPANPRRLRSITSSDGNTISLGYGSHGKISTVTHNGRTWQYQYGSADGATLTAVVQPDASRWTFQYGDLHTMLHHDNQRILWADCEPHVPGQATATVTIGHPSGATGTFNFRSMMHGTERTPGACYLPDPDKPLHAVLSDHVMVYKTASLTSKQISGPGLPTQNWSFNYFPNWSWNVNGYVDDCTGDVCNTTIKTEVTAPDGSITRSTFGNDYWRNAGQLLKVETLQNGSVVQSVTNTYLASAAGQPFPDAAGIDPNPRNNRLVSEKNRPLSSTVTVRDGDSFARSTQSFDAFVRPVRVVKSNSLGRAKEEVTEYHDHLGLWVLGQVQRQYTPSTDVHGRSVPGVLVSVETQFNAQALPWKTYKFGKLQQTLSYTPQGQLSSVADGNGNVVSLSDYYRGVPRSIRFPATPEAPAGATQSAVVDANGWITATIDEFGSKTCFGYDVMGRINNVVFPSETQTGVCDTSRWAPVSAGFQQIAAAEYGLPAGHWRLHRYEGTKHTNTYFDAMWRPVLEETLDASDIGGTRSQIVKRYDAMGRVSFVSYPQRNVGSFLDVTQGTRTAYDVLGRVTRTEQDSEHGSLATTTEYLSGLRTRVTNPRGAVTVSSHLAWDAPSYELPISSVMPENKIIEIERHPQFGWPLRLTQRSADYTQSQSRRYVYDGNALLCKTIEPETGATVMGYDGAGNLTWNAAGLDLAAYGDSFNCNHSAAHASGRRVDRSYDSRNRLVSLAFPDTRGNQSWTYLADGLPSTVAVSNGINGSETIRTTYIYNKRRLLISETLNQIDWYAWTQQYGYDSIGNLASLTYPTGLHIDYAPNALGQATKAGPYASNAQYYPNGALKQFTYGNGVTYSMSQNARQLPLNSISTGVSHLEYGYDVNGNIGHIYDLNDGLRSRWMTYDGLDRLTSAGSAMFGGDHWHRFTYDALDNLKSWKLAGVKDYADYIYDAQTHRLSAIRNSLGANVENFAYDPQGNLLSKNAQAFEFDFGNRLRNVPSKERYRYDGLGRRVQSTQPSGATTVWQYTQSGQMLFSSSWDNASYLNHRTREHVYLAGSQIATIDHAWPSNLVTAVKYHHTDALGSPIAVTNTAGLVIERNNYEPWGAVIGQPSFSGVGFTGHVMDGATGLTQMQQRYYDQNVGRFLSVDPVAANPDSGANFNRYWYANNNPYVFVDPDGRAVERIENGEIRGADTTVDLIPAVERPARQATVGIVLHRTVSSSATSAINESRRNNGRTSFHIVIDKDGSTTQIANMDNVANHVGRPTGNITNQNSIGIEVVGNYDRTTGTWDPLTPAQIESVAQAVITISDAYGINQGNVFSHEGVSRKTAGEGQTVIDAISDRVTEIRALRDFAKLQYFQPNLPP